MLRRWADFIEDNALKCFYKEHFGLECFGCGFQRSIVLLFRGELVESIKMFPALYPLILLLVFLPYHLWKKPLWGYKVILILFINIVLVLMINFIYKQILFWS